VSSGDDTLPPDGLTIQRAFDALVATLEERQVRYAIIGGIATVQHSRLRTTDDIDVIVLVPQLSMPSLFDSLKARGFDLDVMQAVRELRDEGLTSIQHGSVFVDLMRPVLPAYAHVLDRAVVTQIFGRSVRISAPEGLIIMKVAAWRLQDQADVRDLLTSVGEKLDLPYVRAELNTIMPADDPRRVTFEEWVRQANQNP
jgi:hypothetical protein